MPGIDKVLCVRRKEKKCLESVRTRLKSQGFLLGAKHFPDSERKAQCVGDRVNLSIEAVLTICDECASLF